MCKVLKAVREEMDAEKQTQSSLPYYALTHGPKRVELLRMVGDCGIVPPHRATKEQLAWIIVQFKAEQGEDLYVSEVVRLSCPHCEVCYFDDNSDKNWVCCSERRCFRWLHVECDGAQLAAVKKEKKFICSRCKAGKEADDVELEDVFFEGDRTGPPSVSLDEALSEHHVADCIRANRHVMLGQPVFPDDVVGAV